MHNTKYHYMSDVSKANVPILPNIGYLFEAKEISILFMLAFLSLFLFLFLFLFSSLRVTVLLIHLVSNLQE